MDFSILPHLILLALAAIDPSAADVRLDTKWTNLIGNYFFVTVKKNTHTMD